MLHVDPAAPWNEKNMRSDTLLSSGPFLSSLFSKAHKKISQIDITPFGLQRCHFAFSSDVANCKLNDKRVSDISSRGKKFEIHSHVLSDQE
jgi:hypothetical protein